MLTTFCTVRCHKSCLPVCALMLSVNYTKGSCIAALLHAKYLLHYAVMSPGQSPSLLYQGCLLVELRVFFENVSFCILHVNLHSLMLLRSDCAVTGTTAS